MRYCAHACCQKPALSQEENHSRKTRYCVEHSKDIQGMRAGDVVFCRVMNKQFTVAAVNEPMWISTGLKPHVGRTWDCVVVEHATDDQHILTLSSWAEVGNKGDERHNINKRTLKEWVSKNPLSTKSRAST